MATVDDSKPIHRGTCTLLTKKMNAVQLGMLEHAGAGFPDKGLNNSFNLRCSLWDLKTAIDKVLDVKAAS